MAAKRRLKLFLRVVSGVIPLLAASPALAIVGTTVSPPSQEIEVAPGATYSGSLSVDNDGSTAITYKATVSDYRVDNELYHADFNSTSASAITSPVSWIHLGSTSFILPAGASLTLPYTITAPKNAAVGGHYAAIFVANVPPVGVGSTVINRIQKIGSLLYISVTGAVSLSGNIASFSASHLQWSTPIGATLRVQNAGNDHFAASGEATATPLFGTTGVTTAFKGEVLPGTTRRFDLQIPARRPIGIYQISITPHYLNANGPTVTRWVVVIPALTFIILVSTLVLMLSFAGGLLVRRVKRRRHSE